MRQKVFVGKLIKKFQAKMAEKQNYGGVQQLPMTPVGYDERIQYSSGGKASANIHEMELACNQMAGYNRSLTK